MNEQPVALVTGSSKGVGRGIAQHFLETGYRVVGCSRGPSSLESDEYYHTVVDVGIETQVREWIRSVSRSHGRIDVVVNNAGVYFSEALVPFTSIEMVESSLRTNFLGTFAVCREASKIMLKQKFGRIINISSIATGHHMPGTSAYSTSKSAVVELSKVLAKELISGGITCNVLAISLVESPTTTRISNQIIDRYKSSLAIERWANVDDVCNVIEFFASPASGHITGQVIHLDFVD